MHFVVFMDFVAFAVVVDFFDWLFCNRLGRQPACLPVNPPG